MRPADPNNIPPDHPFLRYNSPCQLLQLDDFPLPVEQQNEYSRSDSMVQTSVTPTLSRQSKQFCFSSSSPTMEESQRSEHPLSTSPHEHDEGEEQKILRKVKRAPALEKYHHHNFVGSTIDSHAVETREPQARPKQAITSFSPVDEGDEEGGRAEGGCMESACGRNTFMVPLIPKMENNPIPCECGCGCEYKGGESVRTREMRENHYYEEYSKLLSEVRTVRQEVGDLRKRIFAGNSQVEERKSEIRKLEENLRNTRLFIEQSEFCNVGNGEAFEFMFSIHLKILRI